MANKTIKGNEIIEDNHLSNPVKSADALKKAYKELDTQIKKTAQSAKAGFSGVNPNSAKGIREVNTEVTNSIKLRKAQIDINKKRQQLQREEIKTNELIARQTKRAIADKRKEDAADQKRLKTIRESNSAYKKQSKELADLSRRYKDLSIAGRGAGKVARGLLVDIKRLNAGLVKADAATGKFGRNVGNYPKTLGKATAGLKSFAGALGLAGGVAILAKGLKDAVKLFVEFEQANANLASILGDTKGGIIELTNDAKRLGSISAFTASQITGLQTELGKLGFNRKEILESTAAISQLAAATGGELAEAAIVAGATLGGFGLEAIDTQRVVDVMAKSFSSTALDMEKFKESMKSAAPAAKAVGISVEETTALLGTLSNAGISGSKAGNNLKTTFINLNAAGLTLEEGLAKVANSQDKLGTATKLVGKNAAASFLVLSDGVDTTERLTESFINSGGAAQEMADTQLDTLQGSLTLLTSAYEGFILSLEDGSGGFSKWIRNTIDATAVVFNFLSGIEQTDEQLKKLRFGDTIVKIKNFIDTWSIALESVENFTNAMKDTVDILTAIITFGLIENVSDDFLGLADAVEKYESEQREAIRITALAQKGIKKLTESVTKYTAKEQARVTALAEGNLTQEQRNILIADLNEKYPELLENYDLENLSQEDAIRLNKELQKEIINTAIIKQKALAIAFLNAEVEKELDKARKITNKDVQAQRIKDIEGTEKLQLLRIDALEEETRIRLGLIDVIKDQNDAEGGEDGDNGDEDTGTGGKKTSKTKRSISTAADKEELRLTRIRRKKRADEKKSLADENRDFNDFLNEKEGLENAHFDRILDDQTREENAVRDKYFTLIELAVKYNEDTALLEEARQKELQDIQNRFDEKARKEQEELDKKAQKEQLDNTKKAFDDLNNLLQLSLDNTLSKIDLAIQQGQDKIGESEQLINDLKERADLGSLEAENSIKAEQQAIANERASIEALEKKKKDLLIIVTGLNLVNQKIQNGDSNATASASGDLSGFLDGLSGFYKGTDTTLGASLGGAFDTGEGTDSLIVRADKREMIVGVDNMAKMPKGITQNEVVRRVNLADNGMFEGVRAVTSMTNQAIFNDSRMVSAMSEVKEAINNIRIPEHKFNYNAVTKMATDSMRIGNKTINNHTKVDNSMF